MANSVFGLPDPQTPNTTHELQMLNSIPHFDKSGANLDPFFICSDLKMEPSSLISTEKKLCIASEFFSLETFLPKMNKGSSAKDEESELDFDKQFCKFSDFSDNEENEMMLDFIRLKPINGQQIGGIYTPLDRKYTRSNSLFDDEQMIPQS